MIDTDVLAGSLVFAAATGSLAMLLAGVRRLPWRHAALIGLGQAIVFAALAAAMFGRASPELVLVGAIGGGLAVHGFEHGERERRRISDSITAIRPTPPA